MEIFFEIISYPIMGIIGGNVAIAKYVGPLSIRKMSILQVMSWSY